MHPPPGLHFPTAEEAPLFHPRPMRLGAHIQAKEKFEKRFEQLARDYANVEDMFAELKRQEEVLSSGADSATTLASELESNIQSTMLVAMGGISVRPLPPIPTSSVIAIQAHQHTVALQPSQHVAGSAILYDPAHEKQRKQLRLLDQLVQQIEAADGAVPSIAKPSTSSSSPETGAEPVTVRGRERRPGLMYYDESPEHIVGPSPEYFERIERLRALLSQEAESKGKASVERQDAALLPESPLLEVERSPSTANAVASSSQPGTSLLSVPEAEQTMTGGGGRRPRLLHLGKTPKTLIEPSRRLLKDIANLRAARHRAKEEKENVSVGRRDAAVMPESDVLDSRNSSCAILELAPVPPASKRGKAPSKLPLLKANKSACALAARKPAPVQSASKGVKAWMRKELAGSGPTRTVLAQTQTKARTAKCTEEETSNQSYRIPHFHSAPHPSELPRQSFSLAVVSSSSARHGKGGGVVVSEVGVDVSWVQEWGLNQKRSRFAH
ncbi:hypothetical protein DFH11DRAFT_1549823 [Phellopilus nigrolimitatus]|nr:hypothetical protein DFH11DRAFT_1549823 [Phellopilus nigrolimitatus]